MNKIDTQNSKKESTQTNTKENTQNTKIIKHPNDYIIQKNSNKVANILSMGYKSGNFFYKNLNDLYRFIANSKLADKY